MEPNFLQKYGHRTIAELTSDWADVRITRESDPWTNFPPEDFLDFVKHYPATPFDLTAAGDNLLKPTSFLLRQVHRYWQTSSLAYAELSAVNAKRLVDLGSFPFFVPFLLRDYFGYKGEIAVTTNVALSAPERDAIAQKDIQVYELDLDPYVSDPATRAGQSAADSRELVTLPVHLPLDAGTVDVVLMSHVIEHLYHPRSILGECSRVLRPQGRLVVTTDNAMMADVFANYVGGYGHTFEPVETTAAMSFHFWRAHVRYFTARDLSTLMSAAGIVPKTTIFSECMYDVFFNEHFPDPDPKMCGWKRTLVADTPWLRNEVAIVGEKSA